MDFKFRKIKVIVSIIIPLVIWILIFTLGPSWNNPPAIIRSFLEIHNRIYIFAFGNISLFIMEVAIIYVLWSLFQKKHSL